MPRKGRGVASKGGEKEKRTREHRSDCILEVLKVTLLSCLGTAREEDKNKPSQPELNRTLSKGLLRQF